MSGQEERTGMKRMEEETLLRVFIAESDSFHGKPLYERIVLEARSRGLSGTTVLRGMLGFGAHSRLHSAHLLALSEDLPVVVEIVDSEENIGRLLPFLDESVGEGLVTLERVRTIRYRKE